MGHDDGNQADGGGGSAPSAGPITAHDDDDDLRGTWLGAGEVAPASKPEDEVAGIFGDFNGDDDGDGGDGDVGDDDDSWGEWLGAKLEVKAEEYVSNAMPAAKRRKLKAEERAVKVEADVDDYAKLE